MRKLVGMIVGFVVAVSAAVQTASAQECGEWSDIFSSGNLWGAPRDWVEFDDGTGKALYACGLFMWPGWQQTQSVLRYRDGRWEEVGSLKAGFAHGLCVFENGNGPQLYVAYDSATNVLPGISRWNGTTWERVAQFDDSPRAIEVYNGNLYAVGDFQTTNGVTTNYVAMWDGVALSPWSAVGPGLKGFNNNAYCLTVFDDGTGASLYAGGEFRIAGTNEATGIARWDGALWHPVGSGVNISSRDSVNAMKVHDDGSGQALYVGGRFSSAGAGVPETYGIARWDGSSWTSVGGGLYETVYALEEYESGGKSDLYAGETGIGLRKWDGQQWSQVGPAGIFTGSNALVSSMVVYDDGNGNRLFVGGNIDSIGALQANGIAVWDGTSWEIPLQGFFDPIENLVAVNENTGNALYVAGQFESAGNIASKYIIKWDGSVWSGLAGGANDRVLDIAMFDDGTGEALFATGRFTEVGGSPIKYVAKWDGQQWTPLGPGINGMGRRLIVFDDGTGPALYVAGSFTVAGQVSALGVAKWNGFFWSAVGANITGDVAALAVHDDGAGDALYVAATSVIHRWDGLSWTTLPVGTISGNVLAMASWDDGNGADLYLGGTFETIGGVSTRSIAKWNGSTVSALRNGLLSTTSTTRVFSLGVFDDGSGSALYAGGTFNFAGALAVGDIVKWDGSDWSDVGGGTDNSGVYALETYDLGTGPNLYAAGGFRAMSGVSSDHIARLDPGHCGCFADCDHSTGLGVLDIFDFLCFQNEFVSGSSYACDCNTSTGMLVCDVFDFLCFQDEFVSGCP